MIDDRCPCILTLGLWISARAPAPGIYDKGWSNLERVERDTLQPLLPSGPLAAAAYYYTDTLVTGQWNEALVPSPSLCSFFL